MHIQICLDANTYTQTHRHTHIYIDRHIHTDTLTHTHRDSYWPTRRLKRQTSQYNIFSIKKIITWRIKNKIPFPRVNVLAPAATVEREVDPMTLEWPLQWPWLKVKVRQRGWRLHSDAHCPGPGAGLEKRTFSVKVNPCRSESHDSEIDLPGGSSRKCTACERARAGWGNRSLNLDFLALAPY